ncbi:MAG: Ig-like domain-containing protein [Kineosporiaceae bacterium]
MAVTPADDAQTVRLDQAVVVEAASGRLATVKVSNGQAELPGEIDAAGRVWRSSGTLAAASTYTVSVTSQDETGRSYEKVSSFSTLKPTKTVSAAVTPKAGWTVGVGMPVIVDFNRAVTDRKAAVAGLSVTTSPKQVNGAWRWLSSKQVQWRPEAFWPAGTKVTVTTDLAGRELAKGVWGKPGGSTTFTIGSAMVTTVDTLKHRMTVRQDGKVIKVIPVTTGKKDPRFETRNGIKVIMLRESERQMDAATTGLDPKDPEYYNVTVKWAMRLTWSGEFLHAAPWSVGSQGRANVSHGCTGMSTANAKWMFDHSKVGDVVIYTGSNRKMEWGNGYTAWNLSFKDWASGGGA